MASRPSRAVATTRNSAPPRTSTSTRRISALSSTTRTDGTGRGRSDDMRVGPDGADLCASVLHVKPDAATALAAHGLADDRNAGRAERTAACPHVALAPLERARRLE